MFKPLLIWPIKFLMMRKFNFCNQLFQQWEYPVLSFLFISSSFFSIYLIFLLERSLKRPTKWRDKWLLACMCRTSVHLCVPTYYYENKLNFQYRKKKKINFVAWQFFFLGVVISYHHDYMSFVKNKMQEKWRKYFHQNVWLCNMYHQKRLRKPWLQ